MGSLSALKVPGIPVGVSTSCWVRGPSRCAHSDSCPGSRALRVPLQTCAPGPPAFPVGDVCLSEAGSSHRVHEVQAGVRGFPAAHEPPRCWAKCFYVHFSGAGDRSFH